MRDVELGGWDGNEIYDLRRNPHGAGTAARTRLYGEIVDAYFEETYDARRPDDLVHVTCTGYASPSGAQQLVARRGWQTRVTHAYHMGCYAAVPAVRIAPGSRRWARGASIRAYRAVLAAPRSRRPPDRAARRASPSEVRCSSQASQDLRRSGVCSLGLFHSSDQTAGAWHPLAEQTGDMGPTLATRRMSRATCNAGRPRGKSSGVT